MLFLILSLTACAPTNDERRFFAMDTVMSLKVWGGDQVCEKLEARARELDKKLSSADPDSEICRLNQTHTAALSDDVIRPVRRALDLSGELEGFDPTVYPAVLEWGFISGDYHIPDETRLRELTSLIDSSAVVTDGSTVTMPAGMMLDLGAIAKGYLADECKKILAGSGASGAILNLGGTILLYGKKPDGTPFKVGIADPDDPSGYFGKLSCSEGVVATSGGYERYFEQDGKRYIHILDPTTAEPVDNGILSVTVCSEDGALADALSTALFVMGADAASRLYRDSDTFEFIILTDDDRLYITEGVCGDFTLTDGHDYTLCKVTK